MTIESAIFSELSAIVPRTFPDFAPTNTARPYVTYQFIGGESINYTDKTLPNARNAMVQVNVWANTRKSANETIRQIEDALRLSTLFSASPMSEPMHGFDADMPVYSAIQDFTVWADR